MPPERRRRFYAVQAPSLVAHFPMMRVLVLTSAISLLAGWPVTAADDISLGFVDRLVSQTENLRPEVLGLAIAAYAEALEDGHISRERLTVIDYGLPSYEERLWVIDMETAKDFSNLHGSKKSSLGLFVTAETYQGQHGYTLRLDGLEEGVNDNARERLIVIHSAHYVTDDRADDRMVGRSWGCPVVRPEISRELIDAIKDGSALWIYYPDEDWLEESEFLDEE